MNFKIILKSVFIFIVLKLRLIPQEEIDRVYNEYERRKKICDTCPLRTGNWCDKHKVVINHYYKPPVLTSGCGCYLPLKMYGAEPEGINEYLCPLNLW